MNTATNLVVPIVLRELGPEAQSLMREVERARAVIAAATELQDALTQIKPSDRAWPTKRVMDGLEAAQRELARTIYEYQVALIGAPHIPVQGHVQEPSKG